MKSMFISLIWAILITTVAAAYSESNIGTLSTIRNYIVTNLDSVTDGEIVKSKRKIVGRFGVEAYDIRYAYTVNSDYYNGSQVNYDARTSRPAEILKKYPLGMEIKVYYDSSKPQYSALEKSSLGFRIYFEVLLFMAAFVLTIVLYYAIKRT